MNFNPNSLMPLEEQPQNFLGAVWRLLPNEGLVGLSHNESYLNKDGGKEEAYYQTWQYASERAQINWYEVGAAYNDDPNLQKDGKGSIYYNFSSRAIAMLNRNPNPKVLRGKADELIGVCMFGGDLDCDNLGYPIDQAYAEIMSCPLRPSIVVHSGGGLQPIWLFDTAWMIQDASSAFEYGQYSRGFMQWVAKFTKATPDYSVNEPARVLRLPGFRNNKLERNGAYAYLLHFDPDMLYSIEELKSHVTLPDYTNREHKTYTTSSDNVYAVSKYLVNHLVYQTPPKGRARHPALRNIAAFAAASKIPQEVVTPAIRKLARLWFEEAPHRAAPGGETDEAIQWSYDHAESMNFEPGGDYAIKIDGENVSIVTDQELEKQKRAEKIVKLDAPPELPLRKPLDVVREEQDRFIDDYLRKEFKRGYPTLAVVRSSPGAGKTTAAIRISYQLVKEAIEAGLPPPKVLYLTQFKMNDYEGRAWVREMGIDPDEFPDMFGFFQARETEPTPGYCANYDLAKTLGGKGYNVVKHLCNFCPFKTKCAESGYLSQFDKLRDKTFVIARYQQGMIEELQQGRKIVIIDEEITSIIAKEIRVTPNDAQLSRVDPVTYDQYKSEVMISEKFLTTLRAVMASNGDKEQKLRGFWLMDSIVKMMGKEAFEAALELDKRIVEGLQAVDTSSVVAVAQSQPNFMRDLWRVLHYEYETYYAQGALAWNSRLILHGMNLNIHPMSAFTFPADVKVLCLDATSMPQYYDLVITDRHVETIDGTKFKAPRPRHTITYDTKLAIRGVTTQFLGSENSRTTYSHKQTQAKVEAVEAALNYHNPDINVSILAEPEEEQKEISFKRFYRHSTKQVIAVLREKHYYALANMIQVIEELALKFEGGLLLVSYKGLIDGKKGAEISNAKFLKDWIKANKLIPEQNIQWFGNLRGKNDWKHCKAVLIIGTPRIPEQALLARASIYHYQDANPLDTTRKWRILPYAQDKPLQIGKEIGFFGYQYYGYADDRLDRWFVYTIVSEIIQAYDRIRSNSSVDTRNIYLGTAFPCSEHVSAFRFWNSGNVSIMVNDLLEEEYKKSISDPDYQGYLVSEMVAKIQEAGNCSDNLARDLYTVEFSSGYIETEAGRVYWADHFGRVTTVGRTSRVSNKESKAELSLSDKVVAWLRSNPSRVGSGESMARWYQLDNPLEKAPSSPTMIEGRKKYQQWLADMGKQAKASSQFLN